MALGQDSIKVDLRIPEKVFRALKKDAGRHGMTLSAFVRHILNYEAKRQLISNAAQNGFDAPDKTSP